MTSLSDPNTHGPFVDRAAWEASGFIEILELCALSLAWDWASQPAKAEPCRGRPRQRCYEEH